MSTTKDWVRLGRLLTARRIELGYPVRSRFVDARELSHGRTISDIENAKRDNFEPATLALVEQLYEWAPGSIEVVLKGGEPTALTRGSSAVEDVFSMISDPRAHVRKRTAERDQWERDAWFEGPMGVDGYGRDLRGMRDELLAEHWNTFESEAARALREFARRHEIAADRLAEDAMRCLIRDDPEGFGAALIRAETSSATRRLRDSRSDYAQSDPAPSRRAGGSPADGYTLAAMDRDDSEEIEAQQNEP